MRLFCYGFLSVILALYLVQAGLSDKQVGLLVSLTLAGDAVVTLWLTTRADRFGRRRTLIVGALLMIGAGLVFILTRNLFLLMAAAIIGVISPSGNEIGPFLSVEQAGLTHLITDRQRTTTFAWYNLAGSFATATGALAGGWLSQGLMSSGLTPYNSYRVVLVGYALGGLVLLVIFNFISSAIEIPATGGAQGKPFTLGLSRSSRGIILRLSALFSLDAFGGALVVQSLVAYWFHLRFGIAPGVIGSIFFGANILAGFSALTAGWMAKKIGLINTMVFTHIPSNILLILVPLMPTLPLAILVLLLRFSISQMDVPTRQSYTMAVVSPEERSAAAGVTSIARSVGAAFSPAVTGFLLSIPLLSAPFLISGGLKIIYDLILYYNFRTMKPPEERAPAAPSRV